MNIAYLVLWKTILGATVPVGVEHVWGRHIGQLVPEFKQ